MADKGFATSFAIGETPELLRFRAIHRRRGNLDPITG